MKFKLGIIFLAFISIANASYKRYDGHKLYKIVPQDDSEVEILREIQKKNLGEFWSHDFGIGYDVRVMVAPENTVKFLSYFGPNYKVTEVIGDVQKAIDHQLKPALTRSTEQFLSLNWTEYHDLETINTWLDELEETYPEIVRTVSMTTTSYEGREIKGVVIDYHPERTSPLIGVIEGTLHAREWISAATVTWIIKEFLNSADSEVKALAEALQWHLFPVVNPDGYHYTFTTNRLWRKNRNPEHFRNCAHLNVEDDLSNGIDLNRNFNFEWMSIGASDDPCSNTYAGPTPLSEPEARAITQYVTALSQRGEIIYYIAFHSYSQLIIMPYSNVASVEQLDTGLNYADLYEIGVSGAEVLRTRYGTEYRVGISANVMYPMSGTSFDWVKQSLHVPVTYLFELRDRGVNGFLLPPEEIIPNNLEIMDAFVEMDKTTRRLGYYSGASNVFSSLFVIAAGILVVLLK